MNQTILPRGRFPLIFRWLILSIAIGLLIITLANPATAQEKLMRTITVTGVGEEMIPTTLTEVQLGVEIQGATAKEVQQEVARRTAAVVELLRSRNVEKLQTTGIQLQPNYDYNNNERRLVGYIGTNTVSFRINTEQTGTLLDQAVQAGATRIDNISFTASQSAIAAAKEQALQKATQDAREQANVVLSSLSLSPKETVSIQVNGAGTPPPPPLPVARSAALESQDTTTPVIGGEQTVQASVTLQISY